MKINLSHIVSVLFISSLTVGCSGESENQSNVTTELELVKLNEKKLYGAWKSQDGTFGYEFHASPTQEGTIDPDFEVQEIHLQNEGVIYRDGKKSEYFNWRLLADGSLQLDIRERSCQSRPLVICAREAIQRIEVIGSNANNLDFRVTQDSDLDGTFDANYDWKLSQQKLPSLDVGEKAYFMQSNYRAESQIYGSSTDGQLKLFHPVNAIENEFVESNRNDYLIEFQQSNSASEQYYFYVYNHGWELFDVKANYEYFLVYPSFDGELIVSFAFTNEMNTSADINPADIDLEDFIENVRFSNKVNVQNVGSYAPTIEFGKEYYSWFVDATELDGRSDISANLLVFVDENTATISARDVVANEIVGKSDFSWSYGAHNGEIILENANKKITIEFLQAQGVNRDRILTTIYDKQRQFFVSKSYSDYLFSQNEQIDVSTLLPRRFEFVNSNGVTVSPVTLLEDGEVVLGNVDSTDGGRWYFHENTNEVVRYECLAVGGALMEDFQQCKDSFEVAATADATTTYSHISHLKFLNKFGNTYLVQYDATFWGGRFDDDFVNTISGYYLWTHLPQ